MEAEKLENNTTYGFSIFIRIILLAISISFIHPGIEYLFMSKEIGLSKVFVGFWVFFYFIDKINIVYQYKLYGIWWLQKWILIEKREGKSFTSRILAFTSSVLIIFNTIFCFFYLCNVKILPITFDRVSAAIGIYILIYLLWSFIGEYLAQSAFFIEEKIDIQIISFKKEDFGPHFFIPSHTQYPNADTLFR
jgi:hypothetical protein